MHCYYTGIILCIYVYPVVDWHPIQSVPHAASDPGSHNPLLEKQLKDEWVITLAEF